MWNPRREIYIIEAIFVKFDTWVYIEGYNIDTTKWYKRAYNLYFYIEDSIVSAPIFGYYKALKEHIKILRSKYTSDLENIISNFILEVFNNFVKPVAVQIYDYYLLFVGVMGMINLYLKKKRNWFWKPFY